MPRTLPFAKLTVPAPQVLSLEERNNIMRWLDGQADKVVQNGDQFVSRAKARIQAPRPAWPTDRNYTIAKLHLDNIDALSLATRKRIAKWLRSRALHIGAGSRGIFRGRWFTQEFSL